MLHVLIGQTMLAERLGRSKAGQVEPWIVPKSACPGDAAVFFFRGPGLFLARGEVLDPPRPGQFGKRAAYGARVRVYPLPQPIAFARVARAMPDWAWCRYPRSLTSLAPPLDATLMRVLDKASAVPGLSRVEPSALEGMATEARVLQRTRNRGLRDEALRQAEGICACCNRDFASILDGRGVRVLQVHHQQQLGWRSTPRVTRLRDLAVVCANCHLLLHLDPKRPMAIAELRMKLKKGL